MSPLLAMTEFAVWLGVPAILLCLAMIIYSFVSRRDTKRAERPSIAWTLFVALLVFLAVWLWLSPAIFLLSWAAWFGDNMPLWFRKLTPWLAAGVGLLVAAAVAFRGRRMETSDRYLRIHLVTAATLLVLLGIVMIYGWASRIYGATPKAAAEEYVDKLHGLPESYRIIEERRWGTTASGESHWASFRIIGADDVAIGRITVARYSRFWWTFASYRGVMPADKALERAEELLNDPARQNVAQRLLRELIENHPESREAQAAERLLNRSQAEAGTEKRPIGSGLFGFIRARDGGVNSSLTRRVMIVDSTEVFPRETDLGDRALL